jgi:DNA polymerase (family 10)
MLKNSEVADLLEKIALLLEASGEEERFKVVAYRRAATSIRNLEEDIEEIWKRGKLSEVKYVGEGIAKKINQYLRDGRSSYLEELEKKVPEGTIELMQVQGIGPKTAYKLANNFGIKSVEQLKKAIQDGSLDEFFGESVRRSLLASIEKLQSYEKRMLLPEAELIAKMLDEYFSSNGVKIIVAGSLRRGKSTVGDIDIISTSKDSSNLLTSFSFVDSIIESGPKRVSVRLKNGVQVDLRIFEEEELGAALLYFTGSKQHNIALRNIALEKNMKLNEYGLFDQKTNNRLAGRTEEEIYRKLGMTYIEPELREDRGEIEAAIKNNLPTLIKLEDIKGDLQVHTSWSDGADEIEVMAEEARKRGYSYVAFTDHSLSASIANGLSEERFRKQWKKIDDLNESIKPFKILKGVELEIRADGSVDYSKEFLQQFDVVGASLHQGYKQNPEKLTERIIRAINNPHIQIIFHPTNRLLGRREGHDIDLAMIIKEARNNGKILEIDGQPNRLDLDDVWAKKAMEEGVKMVIDSDAHSSYELENMKYGVITARRAWLEPKHIINTMRYEELIKLLA